MPIFFASLGPEIHIKPTKDQRPNLQTFQLPCTGGMYSGTASSQCVKYCYTFLQLLSAEKLSSKPNNDPKSVKIEIFPIRKLF